MFRSWLTIFLSFSTFTVVAQNWEVNLAQALLDSLSHLPKMDYNMEDLEEAITMNYHFRILEAEVYFDCNGDTCFESRKGLITSTHDTIPPVFYNILPLMNGELVLMGLQKAIQIKAPLEVTQVYDHFGPLIDDLVIFIQGNHYGLMDESGTVLLPASFDYIENNEDNSTVMTRLVEIWKTHDKDSLLGKEQKDEFEISTDLVNSLLKVQDPKSGYWALFSLSAMQLTDYKYEAIEFTHNGNAIVGMDGYWGLANDEGVEVTEIKYDDIRGGFGVTYIGVQGVISQRFGLLSTEGELTPVIYSRISTTPLYNSDREYYYWVAKEAVGKWGLIRLDGVLLTDFDYDEINLDDREHPKGLINSRWIEILK